MLSVLHEGSYSVSCIPFLNILILIIEYASISANHYTATLSSVSSFSFEIWGYEIYQSSRENHTQAHFQQSHYTGLADVLTFMLVSLGLIRRWTLKQW